MSPTWRRYRASDLPSVAPAAISEPATENNAQPTSAIWYGNRVEPSSATRAGPKPMVAMIVAATATPTAEPT